MSKKNRTEVTSKINKSNMQNITTAGKTSSAAYFEKSGIRRMEKLTHNPFVVFNETDSGVEVEIVDNAADLIKYPSYTKVMHQWMGESRSDFFRFTVGDLKKYVKENPRREAEVI